MPPKSRKRTLTTRNRALRTTSTGEGECVATATPPAGSSAPRGDETPSEATSASENGLACVERPAKRERRDCEDGAEEPEKRNLMSFTADILENIFRNSDAKSLAVLSASCKSVSAWDKSLECRRFEQGAKEQLIQLNGLRYAQRWRHYNWLKRLHIEEYFSDFDREVCTKQGFVFAFDAKNQVSAVKLEGIGPKLLVSTKSTADVPFLRSAITVGSMLPLKLPLMKGSIIEVLATKAKLEFIISNPPDGVEMTWQNSTTLPRPYM
eukprot:gene457-1862_t